MAVYLLRLRCCLPTTIQPDTPPTFKSSNTRFSHSSDGMADPDKLDADEYLQFAYLGISLFRKYENAYFQYKSGMIDDEFWDGHRDNLLWFFHRPGTQRWWKERRLGFSKSFREYLESTSQSDMSEQEGRYV